MLVYVQMESRVGRGGVGGDLSLYTSSSPERLWWAMVRCGDNFQFAFLTNLKSPEHIYDRWKLYSILQVSATQGWWARVA
jgi:hypothetical protein